MKNRFRQFFMLLLVLFVGVGLVACAQKPEEKPVEKPTEEQEIAQGSWRTPGYVQGDFGNVPRLGEDGVAVIDESIPDSRIFTSTVNGMEKPIRNTLYYEVNDTNILNATTLTIGDTGVPFADIVIIFAANIHWDSAKSLPYLAFNYNVNALLEGHEKYIKPLQDMGIKVVLDILPNHQGVGFRNLRDVDIEEFTDQLVEAADKYGLDGFDFDEEYAGYGSNGMPTSQPNSMSNMLIRLREKLPTHIISVFNFSIPYDMSTRGAELVELGVVDYGWANYGGGGNNPSWLAGRENYTGSSFEMSSNTSRSSQENAAQNTLLNRNGFNMYFNIHNTVTNGTAYVNYAEWFSGATQRLYGMDVVWNQKFYEKDW